MKKSWIPVLAIAAFAARPSVAVDPATAAAAGVGVAAGVAVGVAAVKIIEAKIAEKEVEALRTESGFTPTLTTEASSMKDEQGQTRPVNVMKNLQMPVPRSEMLTSSGDIQPKALGALKRMDKMTADYGARFNVHVPNDVTLYSVSAIRAAAPHATIFELPRGDDFKLEVTPGG